MGTEHLTENHRARILVVDDDIANLERLGNLLQAHYDVFAAPSARACLADCRESAET